MTDQPNPNFLDKNPIPRWQEAVAVIAAFIIIIGSDGIHILDAIFLAIYFIPAIVAWTRRHRQFMAIAVLNVLLGWTVLGWIGALVWACTTDVEPMTPAKSIP